MLLKAWMIQHNTFETILRLVLSMVGGMIIGLDRGVKRRGAGVKTYSLVCLGAALVMLTGEYIYIHFDQTMDIARLGAQVISGVGFLGVGTIIVTGRNQVRGLTTAAGLWTCACIGLAIGIGFYDGALVMMFLCMFILKGMTRIDMYVYRHSKVLDLYIGFESMKQISGFLEEVRKTGCRISFFEVGKSKIEGEGCTALITIELPKKKMREEVLDLLNQSDGVVFVEEL